MSKAAWDELLATLALERARVKYYQDKCDALNTALLKGAAQTVVRLPPAPLTPAPGIPVVAGPSSMEHADTWVSGNRWFGEQKIATPPIVTKEKNQ